MYEIRTETRIAASPAEVWAVLVDFPRYPEWNPFVRSVEGKLEVGARLKISVQPPGARGMTFRPTLLDATPARKLRWLGRLLIPGIFDGEHYFELEPVNAHSTRLTHGERFSGLLVPIARPGLEARTKAGFIAMNEALRARVESLRAHA